MGGRRGCRVEGRRCGSHGGYLSRRWAAVGSPRRLQVSAAPRNSITVTRVAQDSCLVAAAYRSSPREFASGRSPAWVYPTFSHISGRQFRSNSAQLHAEHSAESRRRFPPARSAISELHHASPPQLQVSKAPAQLDTDARVSLARCRATSPAADPPPPASSSSSFDAFSHSSASPLDVLRRHLLPWPPLSHSTSRTRSS